MNTCTVCGREMHYLAPRIQLVRNGWACSEECARQGSASGQLSLVDLGQFRADRERAARAKIDAAIMARADHLTGDKS